MSSAEGAGGPAHFPAGQESRSRDGVEQSWPWALGAAAGPRAVSTALLTTPSKQPRWPPRHVLLPGAGHTAPHTAELTFNQAGEHQDEYVNLFLSFFCEKLHTNLFPSLIFHLSPSPRTPHLQAAVHALT